MDKRTGLDISVCVDMAVVTSPGNASAYIFSVIPEVHCKDWLGLTVLPDLAVHHLPLFHRSHQLFHSAFFHRHVGEELCEFCTHIDHLVKIFLDTDGRHKVLHPEHLVGKLLVDQRSVCKCGEQIDICSKLHALSHDIVHLLIGQIHMAAALCSPAAGTFQVICAGQIQKDCSGYLRFSVQDKDKFFLFVLYFYNVSEIVFNKKRTLFRILFLGRMINHAGSLLRPSCI